MSVTSSGRSSTSRTMSFTSGWLVSIDLTIDFTIVVLPALGGETIIPRWPFPIGESRSIIRAVMLLGSPSISMRSFSSGNSAVRSSNFGLVLAISGSMPLMESMRSSAGFFSLRFAGRAAPTMASPLRRPNWRTCFTER
jgi:hypothetical protein